MRFQKTNTRLVCSSISL